MEHPRSVFVVSFSVTLPNVAQRQAFGILYELCKVNSLDIMSYVCVKIELVVIEHV